MFVLGIDTETTGVNAQAKVVELGMILVDAKTWDTVESFVTKVNPGIPIPPETTAIHGISDADVVSAPTIEEVFETSPFRDWLKKSDSIFGHNVLFDIRKLGEDWFVGKPVIDSLKIVRYQFRTWSSHKLSSCIASLNLPVRDAHNALDDIESSREILKFFSKTYDLDIEGLKNFTTNAKSKLLEELRGDDD